MDLNKFVTGWFKGASVKDVKRENVEDLISYGFLFKERKDLTPAERSTVSTMRQQIEQRWGVHFSEGRTPGLRYMAHVWEPLKVWHKPLLFYAATHATGLLTEILLYNFGFRRVLVGGLSMWIHRPRTVPGLQGPSTSMELKGSPRQGVVARWGCRAKRWALRGWYVTRCSVAATKVYVLESLLRGVRAYNASITSYLSLSELADIQRGIKGGQSRRRSSDGDSDASGDSTFSQASSAPRWSHASMSDWELPPVTPLGAANTLVPLVFIHGVGFGITPYLHLLEQIKVLDAGRPLLVVDVPFVSLRIGCGTREFDDVADAIAAAVHQAGWDRFVVMSHSYGTFVTARLCKRYPQRLAGMCIIDPVCLMTCYPQLLQNFVYGTVVDTSSVMSRVKDYARMMASRDYLIAHTFCRKFMWHRLMLWPDQFPPHSMVVLSGRDDLVPYELVQQQVRLLEGQVRLVCHDHHSHGAFLFDRAALRNILQDFVTHVLEQAS